MKRLFSVFAALMLAAPQARAAGATDLALSYDVYVGGLQALSLGIDLEAGVHAYDMKLALKTHGLIGRLFPWSMDAFSRGQFGNDRIRPASAGQRSLWNGKERSTELNYQPNGTVAVTAVPPRDDAARSRALEDEVSGTVDLVSAILSLLKHVETGEPCQASVPVFDGRRRYDFTARPAGNAVLRRSPYLKFEGEAIACHVFVRPVDGSSRRPALIDLTDENAMTVWIARLLPDVPPVPVKLDMDTGLGAVRAYLAAARRGAGEVPLGSAERKS